MAADTALLEARNLQLRRGRTPVLRSVSLRLAAGERLGLLGLNGAGKSTLLHVLAGIRRPDAGEVRLQGANLYREAHAHTRLALVPDLPALPMDMTTNQWLCFCARMQGVATARIQAVVDALLTRFELQALRQCLPRQLSRGQQQRLSLARALLHQPSVLLLDEPGNGLDPVQAAQIRQDLATLENTGMIIASHLLEDLALCDRVLLLRQGRIEREIPADSLGEKQPLREVLCPS